MEKHLLRQLSGLQSPSTWGLPSRDPKIERNISVNAVFRNRPASAAPSKLLVSPDTHICVPSDVGLQPSLLLDLRDALATSTTKWLLPGFRVVLHALAVSLFWLSQALKSGELCAAGDTHTLWLAESKVTVAEPWPFWGLGPSAKCCRLTSVFGFHCWLPSALQAWSIHCSS